jgi:hypothetical protein
MGGLAVAIHPYYSSQSEFLMSSLLGQHILDTTRNRANIKGGKSGVKMSFAKKKLIKNDTSDYSHGNIVIHKYNKQLDVKPAR